VIEFTIPDHLARTITSLNSDRGRDWLARLPALLDACAERWSPRLLPAFPDLSYNYVVPALCADGTPAVLKVGVPNPELNTEIAALRLYDGRGIVQLLAADPSWGALLLARRG
jgi:streptomycin 6-kinase